MAEWLRREIRNLMGSARVGSNPTAVEKFKTNKYTSVTFFFFNSIIIFLRQKNLINTIGSIQLSRLAQMVERMTLNHVVVGSIPTVGDSKMNSNFY